MVKNLPANAGDPGEVGLISWSGTSRGGENGNPFQYSCLENSIDGGAYSPWCHKKLDMTEQLSTYTVAVVFHSGLNLHFLSEY